MTLFEAIVLGIVEGITEFLPVSSTGHLTITENIFGIPVDAREVTAFTAVIQAGAIAAVILYFRKDLWTISATWLRGITQPEVRGTFDYRMGWYVIVGSIPVVVAALLGESLVTGAFRNLWWVASALIGWSFVMVLAEKIGPQNRGEKDITLRDSIIIGLVQCISLIPGVSRSGATISAGLLVGLDRVASTRIAFFLSIPALTGAAIYELPSAMTGEISVLNTVIATLVSFVVAYISVAWLLRFVAHHSIVWFVGYRLALGAILVTLLATGTISAT